MASKRAVICEEKTYTASRQAIDGAEILGEPERREKRGGQEEELHCECCACDVDLT